jgi:Na+/H+ antiporter NhaC
LGVDPAIVVAVASAGGWGSHICFYSDTAILTSAATGCDNFHHAYILLPYGMLAAFISALCFLAVGGILV